MPDEIHSQPDLPSSLQPEKTSSPKAVVQDLVVAAVTARADIDACTTAIAEINARAEMGMRNRALTLSSVLTVVLLAAHIWFAYMGKMLIFPDFMNQILITAILAPWLGFGLGKAVLMFLDKFGGR